MSVDISNCVTYVSNACNLREEQTVGQSEGITVASAVGVGDHLALNMITTKYFWFPNIGTLLVAHLGGQYEVPADICEVHLET